MTIFGRQAIKETIISLSDETQALARRLADLQGISLEGAIHQALEARAGTLGVAQGPQPRPYSPKEISRRLARINQHARAIVEMPILDHRAPAAIMDELNAI